MKLAWWGKLIACRFRGAGFQAGYARFHAGIFCSTGILA
jgi:hypothetical protein